MVQIKYFLKKADQQAFYDEDLNHWMRLEEGSITIGMTDFAQAFLGKVNNISNLPTIGSTLKRYTIFALVESDKSTTELLLPVEAKILAINPLILSTPSLINTEPYGKGWILKVHSPTFRVEDFLDATKYLEAIHPFFNKKR